MDISVIIVNLNTKDLLLTCLESVYRTMSGLAFEVFLVDNASTDGSPEAVAGVYPQVQIIRNNTNRGFGAANNQAFQRMRGRYALLINTDCRLIEEAAAELLRFMDRTPQAALACGQLFNTDGSKQNSFANFPTLASLLFNEPLLQVLCPRRFPGKRREYSGPIEVESCIGAMMMIRREAIESTRGFDEDYFFFFEETDLAYRLRQAGWAAFFVPGARAFHDQGQTAGHGLKSRKLFFTSRHIFFRKHRPRTYIFHDAAITGRLLVNAFLTLLGVIVTLGLKADLRQRLGMLVRLFGWYVTKGWRQ